MSVKFAHMESFHRSLTKTVTWRAIATLITLGTIFAFTGELGKATTITLSAAALLAVGYYFHERFWNKTHWGRHKAAFVRNEKSTREQ